MHSWGSKIAIILFLADVHIQAYGSTAGLLEPSWVARNLKCFGIRDLDDRWKYHGINTRKLSMRVLYLIGMAF